MARTLPSIATELLKIKLARESGDPTAEKLARQNFDIKLAQLEGQMFEKEYNTARSDLQQAYKALRTAQAKNDALRHKTETEVAKIEGKYDVKQERVRGRQDRKTRLALQEGLSRTETEVAKIEGKYDVEQERVRGRQDRKTRLALQEGLTEVAKIEGKYDVKQERVKGRQDRETRLALQGDLFAQEREKWDYRTNRILELANKHGLPKESIDDIIRAV